MNTLYRFVAACTLILLTSWALPPPATAQIREMSNRKLRAETNRAERQAHRATRKARRENPEAGEYLDMSVYNMKPGATGRKAVKAKDGRDNYQFTRSGEPIVTDAPTLTNKRLKRKK